MRADPVLPAARVDEAIFARHPDYVAVVVGASGLVNGPSDAVSDGWLAAAEASLRARGLDRAADDPHLAAWRGAFAAFGAKPSRYPSSAEALAARVLKGAPLPRVNRLVDAYNAVSVSHLIPVGGEDADRLEGPLRLVVADGSEAFDPRAACFVFDRLAPLERGVLDEAVDELCRRLRQGAPGARIAVATLAATARLRAPA
jgi:DNA/RNA-binding domain of Phe-tRNA-synthetase-like protein